MEVFCSKCGEPWDLDTIHDEAEGQMAGAPAEGPVYAEAFSHVWGAFIRDGCSALNSKCNTDVDQEVARKAGVVYSLLGSDVDGAAATLDDIA